MALYSHEISLKNTQTVWDLIKINPFSAGMEYVSQTSNKITSIKLLHNCNKTTMKSKNLTPALIKIITLEKYFAQKNIYFIERKREITQP